MHLRYIFLFVSLITTSKDKQDTSFYRIHCNKRSRPAPIHTLFFPLCGDGDRHALAIYKSTL